MSSFSMEERQKVCFCCGGNSAPSIIYLLISTRGKLQLLQTRNILTEFAKCNLRVTSMSHATDSKQVAYYYCMLNDTIPSGRQVCYTI